MYVDIHITTTSSFYFFESNFVNVSSQIQYNYNLKAQSRCTCWATEDTISWWAALLYMSIEILFVALSHPGVHFIFLFMPTDPFKVYTLVILKPLSISAGPLLKAYISMCKLGRRDPSLHGLGLFPGWAMPRMRVRWKRSLKHTCTRTHARWGNGDSW